MPLPSQKPSGTRPRAKLILVADDSPETRAVYRGVFFAAGFLVEEAADGLAAVANALRWRPDLIVLDYCMPRMDGGEALQTLARDKATRGIPVILVTGCPSEVPPEVRALAGAVIAKPCDPDDVVHAVQTLVDHGRKRPVALVSVK